MNEEWVVHTLVDITETNVVRGSGKKRNQQRNFDTVQQIVSIFAQPWSKYIHMIPWINTKEFNFGKHYKAMNEIGEKLNIWSWYFEIEPASVFGKDGEFLVKQFHNVPILTGLDENSIINPPIFDITKQKRNIIIHMQ